RLVNVIDAHAHEGPVYVRDEDALYFTSVPVQSDVPLAGSRSVAIRRLQGFKDTPQVGDYVYRCHPQSRQLTVVADCFDRPNGLAFSPDESILYVGDSGAIHVPGDYSVERPHHVQAFDVRDGGHLTNRRLFAVTTPGFP